MLPQVGELFRTLFRVWMCEKLFGIATNAVIPLFQSKVGLVAIPYSWVGR